MYKNVLKCTIWILSIFLILQPVLAEDAPEELPPTSLSESAASRSDIRRYLLDRWLPSQSDDQELLEFSEFIKDDTIKLPEITWIHSINENVEGDGSDSQNDIRLRVLAFRYVDSPEVLTELMQQLNTDSRYQLIGHLQMVGLANTIDSDFSPVFALAIADMVPNVQQDYVQSVVGDQEQGSSEYAGKLSRLMDMLSLLAMTEDLQASDDVAVLLSALAIPQMDKANLLLALASDHPEGQVKEEIISFTLNSASGFTLRSILAYLKMTLSPSEYSSIRDQKIRNLQESLDLIDSL